MDDEVYISYLWWKTWMHSLLPHLDLQTNNSQEFTHTHPHNKRLCAKAKKSIITFRLTNFVGSTFLFFLSISFPFFFFSFLIPPSLYWCNKKMQSKLFRKVQVGMSYYSMSQRDWSTLWNDQFAIVIIYLMNFLRARFSGYNGFWTCTSVRMSQKVKRTRSNIKREEEANKKSSVVITHIYIT